MIILTGNGFNFMINSFIENNKGALSRELKIPIEKIDELISDISEITSLWQEFDELFEELIKTYPEMTHEELIRMINMVLEFFNGSESIERLVPNCSSAISYLKDGLESVLVEKIINICEKFKTFEAKDNYKILNKIFPDFGKSFRDIMKGICSDVLYITTNYDGIKDTLLAENYDFIADGFGMGSNGSLVLTENNLGYNELCLHLHGSYKFQKEFYETIKLRGTTENKNPLMIFNQPELKEKQINSDNVLREYFFKFKNRLRSGEKLIIIGNSLRNEPHIISAINKFFNKEGNTVYIYDACPESVEGILKEKISTPLFDIRLINTKEFSSSTDFINSLKEIN